LLSKRVLSEGVLVSAVATAGEGTGVGAGAGGDGGNGVGDTVFAIDNIACNKTPIHYIQPDLHISSYTQSNLATGLVYILLHSKQFVCNKNPIH